MIFQSNFPLSFFHCIEGLAENSMRKKRKTNEENLKMQDTNTKAVPKIYKMQEHEYKNNVHDIQMLL